LIRAAFIVTLEIQKSWDFRDRTDRQHPAACLHPRLLLPAAFSAKDEADAGTPVPARKSLSMPSDEIARRIALAWLEPEADHPIQART